MKKNSKNQQVKAYTFLLQFSINMIVPICVCSFAGYWLDGKFGTCWLVIAGFFLGALSGMTSIFKMAKEWTKEDQTSVDYPVVTTKLEESDDENHTLP